MTNHEAQEATILRVLGDTKGRKTRMELFSATGLEWEVMNAALDRLVKQGLCKFHIRNATAIYRRIAM
jgi:hypothetical protein